MSGEDILSVIFLALICIVIAGIIRSYTPDNMRIPTFALLAVSLWVGYDYITLQRNKLESQCSKKKKEPTDDEKIHSLLTELSKDDGSNEPEDLHKDQQAKELPPPKQQHKNEFDIALYGLDSDIKTLHGNMGSSGDTKLANRMKYMSLQSRLSQEIRSRHNAEKLRPYFQEELDDNENRDWWVAESDFLDEYM
jgi:hypothetical protein